MGHVADIFDEATLAELPGHIAIGHTRYSTAGDSKLTNAQPILIDCVHGQIGICHNGNIVNANELRDRLVRAGSIFQSNSDTEVVLHLYARSQAGSVRRCDRRVGDPADRRVFAGADHPGPARRGARPSRVPPARARQAGRLVGGVFGNLRARPDWRHLRARRRAGRSGGDQRGGSAFAEAVPAVAAVALHLRARLFRAARQRGLRRERERGPHRARAAAGPRNRRRRGRDRPDSGLGRLRGDWLRRGDRHSAPLRPDPQPLRRPHLHRAGTVDPPLRRQGEAQSRSRASWRASASS